MPRRLNGELLVVIDGILAQAVGMPDHAGGVAGHTT